MPAYLVQADADDPAVRVNGVDAAVVFAADEDDALAMVKSQFDGDGNASWDAATVTELVAATDWTGFRFRIRIAAPAGGPDVVDVEATAASLDALGAALVTALNATALIANAAYESTGQVLTIAAGGSDALGDHTVKAEMLPPGNLPGSVGIPGVFSGLTHEGLASADLELTFAADAYVVPQVFALLRQR